VELRNSKIETYEVTPEDFGLKTVDFSRIASGKTAMKNAQKILYVLTSLILLRVMHKVWKWLRRL